MFNLDLLNVQVLLTNLNKNNALQNRERQITLAEHEAGAPILEKP